MGWLSDRSTFCLLLHDSHIYCTGRDLYIVGCANIGKSTLTDIIIQALLYRGEREGNFRSRRDRERWRALKSRSVTCSSLPGTTLANIRIPCFGDFQQAVWDTPGLVVDVSDKLFPMLGNRLRHFLAQRPSRIEPFIHVEHATKSLALCICDADGAIMVRFEVRLKKNDTADGSTDDAPMRLVWNSILPLEARVMPIEEALQKERELQESIVEREKLQNESRIEYENRKKPIAVDLGIELEPVDEEALKSEGMSPETIAATLKERRARNKALRAKVHDEYERRERERLGSDVYEEKQRENIYRYHQLARDKKIRELVEIHQVILEPNEGMDVMLANFGWLGVLMPRTAKITVFTPQTGVKVGHAAPIAFPISWGDYKNSIQVGSNEEQNKVEDEDMDDWEGPEDVTEDADTEVWDSTFMDDKDGKFTFNQEQNLDADEFGLAHPNQFSKRLVVHNDAKKGDPWDVYRGENVGWMWDNRSRIIKWNGKKIESGWNPIPENWNGKDIRSEHRLRREAKSEHRQHRSTPNKSNASWTRYKERY